MLKTILVTGTKGFLGRNTAKHFSQLGFKVYGIGNGEWAKKDREQWGVDVWIESAIQLESLQQINQKLDLIVHCGGSGSVGFSMQEPMLDFQKTVDGTLAVLEYMRLNQVDAKLIYPSSPAVQGVHDDSPIKETDPSNPVSVYGVHKKMAEELCLSYAKGFGCKVSIIRFFSIYGEGLEKQLLWEACNRLSDNEESFSEFWGTGAETRDWIHVSDAVYLIQHVYENSTFNFEIINGGSGHKTTVKETIQQLVNNLDKNLKFKFNHFERDGDPKYYWADMSKAKDLGWYPKVKFEQGCKLYVNWFLEK